MVVGALLAAGADPVNLIYAANLAGFGLGALIALAGLTWLRPTGVVILAAAFGLAAATSFHPTSHIPHPSSRIPHPPSRISHLASRTSHPAPRIPHLAPRIPHLASRIVSLILIVALVILAITPPTPLDIRLSPYKTLSTLLRYPDTQIPFTVWHAFSRRGRVESSAVRH